jgi:DNA-binding transcriptional LysR family regulator
MAMELMQLVMFMAVVEERSIHRATRRLLRTQPAVSIALGKLEREIGTPLLDRSRVRDYRPTKAGEILYEAASKIIILHNDVVSLLREPSRTSQERLRAGVTNITNLISVSAAMARFHERYPLARFQVACMSIANLAADLDDGKLDFALFPRHPCAFEQSKRFAVVLLHGLVPQVWLVHKCESNSVVAKAFRETLLHLGRI